MDCWDFIQEKNNSVPGLISPIAAKDDKTLAFQRRIAERKARLAGEERGKMDRSWPTFLLFRVRPITIGIIIGPWKVKRGMLHEGAEDKRRTRGQK